MELRFWVDQATGLPHIYDHGVTEEAVWEIIHGTGYEFPGRDQSFVRLGQTMNGRYLQVIYAPTRIVKALLSLPPLICRVR